MTMMLFGYGFYLIVVGMVLFLLLLLRKWVMNSIETRKEQNAMLRELLEILRARGSL